MGKKFSQLNIGIADIRMIHGYSSHWMNEESSRYHAQLPRLYSL